MRKGWEIKALMEVCQHITDGSHFSPPSSSQGEFPYITVKDINNDIIDFENCKFIDKESYETLLKSGCKPNNGDLLFSKDGTVGKVSLVDFDKDFVVLSSLAIVRPKKNVVYPAFLKYILKSPDFLQDAIGLKTGVAIRRIILKNLKQIDICYPKSIEEQQRIVATLDEAFEAIDQAKANTEKNLQNAKDLFQSELNSIFTNKGEGWVEKKLNQISENLDSKRIPITKNVRSSGEYPYFGASGIVDYVADYIFDDDLLLVSEDGANLLARTYPIAFPVSGKIWVNNHAHVLKFDDLTTQRFVEYYLNSIRLDPFVSGMAQPKLNQAMLNKIPIPVPPIKDQKEIVYRLDALSVETKQLEENYRKKLKSLEELKKSILQKAFSGELTTNL